MRAAGAQARGANNILRANEASAEGAERSEHTAVKKIIKVNTAYLQHDPPTATKANKRKHTVSTQYGPLSTR